MNQYEREYKIHNFTVKRYEIAKKSPNKHTIINVNQTKVAQNEKHLKTIHHRFLQICSM